MKKFFLFLQAAIISSVAFANNENYDGQDVSSRDFSNSQLEKSTWVGATAVSTNFSSANLTRADFSNADLTSANFSHAFLTKAIFDYAIIKGADFSYVKCPFEFINKLSLSQSYLDKDLSGTIFVGNVLTDWNLSGQNLSFVNFAEAMLNGVNFSNANLVGVNLAGANLSYANFTGADLTNAIIKGAKFMSTVSEGFTEAQLKSTKSYQDKDLSGVEFIGNDLTRWDLSGQNLSSTNFFSATLNGADLSDADLTSANLKSAKLRAANLSNAVLKNTNMQDCDLSNANLAGARFKNVDLRGATLKNIETNPIYENTIMSDGTIMNFSMGSSADNFTIRYYVDIDENVVSAKISDTDAKILGGAKLTIERSAAFEVIDNSSLTVASDGTIEIITKLNGATKFKIDGNSGLIYEEGATLAVSISDSDFFVGDTYEVAVISFEDENRIYGLSDLVKNKTLFLTVNGEKYKGLWDYILKSDGLYILINIPESSEWAAIFGLLALGVAVRRNLKRK